MVCKSRCTRLIWTFSQGGTLKYSSGRVPRASFGELPPNTLLTADEVADWLQIARRQVQRLGIPWIDLGRKTPRYQVRDILAWLETRPRDVEGRRPSRG